MPDFATFGLFLTAAFILSITPGPGILYVLARSLNGGKQEGLLSSVGLFVGGLFHVIAAAIGLSGLLMTSAIAFSLVKYVGAAYLIYLGIKTLLSRNHFSLSAAKTPQQNRSAFYQGIITEILNPKTALFFLAFIPQFVTADSGSVLMQFLMLGTITASLNLLVDLGVSWFAGPIGQRLKTNRRWQSGQKVASGCTLISLGAYVAVAEQS